MIRSEKKRTNGLYEGRNEKLYLAQTQVGRPNRVHRMDAGWSSEAFKVCGLREDERVREVARED